MVKIMLKCTYRRVVNCMNLFRNFTTIVFDRMNKAAEMFISQISLKRSILELRRNIYHLRAFHSAMIAFSFFISESSPDSILALLASGTASELNHS